MHTKNPSYNAILHADARSALSLLGRTSFIAVRGVRERIEKNAAAYNPCP